MILTSDITNAKIAISLEDCIQTARLTMESLARQRELKEIRKTRENAIQEHSDLQHECQNLMANASKFLKKAMYGNRSFENYMNAARRQHASFPSLYAIRKEAEVIKSQRNLQLFDTYLSIMKIHNEAMYYQMRIARDEQRMILKEQQDRTRVVRAQLYKIVEKNVQSYSYLKHDGNKNSTELQQRILRRRSSLQRIHWESNTNINEMKKTKTQHNAELTVIYGDKQKQCQPKRKYKLRLLNAGAA